MAGSDGRHINGVLTLVTAAARSLPNALHAPARQAIRFRGRSFMALVLAPEAPLGEWFAALDGLLSRTPTFFVGRPVLLDLARLQVSTDELKELVDMLATRAIRVTAMEGIAQTDLGPDLPPVVTGGRAAAFEIPESGPLSNTHGRGPRAPTARPEPEPAPTPTPPRTPEPRSLLIDAPVRSGQSVMFLEGDVTIVGSVASGAEVIAGGSIHVYGVLRGRAIAGATGNAEARIFCHKLEAELVAIDGVYQVADNMEAGVRGRPVQARLENEHIVITALT
jgi:septum site-determining protein MinC